MRTVFILLCLLCSTALASPKTEFSLGRNAYLYGDYPLAIKTLAPLVQENRIQLGETQNISDAYEMLGLSHYYLGDHDKARTIFEQLVLFLPDKHLDPVRVPPPAVAFYEKTRTEMKSKIEARKASIARRQKEEAEARRLQSQEIWEVSYRRNYRLLALVPFGMGQFQNGDYFLGGVFLTAELLAVGLSAGFAIGVEGLRQPNGRFLSPDLRTARNYQTAQLVSGGIAATLILGGVMHALYNFQPEIKVGRERIQTGISPGGASVSIAF